MDSKLKEYFEKHNIHYKIHEHPAVFTVAESKFLKSKIPGMHTKSLFLKDDNGKFYLVCMNAFKRLDIKSLQNSLSVKKLRFASSEELKKELNLTPGSVSIFGMIYSTSTTLIIDQEVWDSEIVGFHPNINTSTLEVSHKDLDKFCKTLETKKLILKLYS